MDRNGFFQLTPVHLSRLEINQVVCPPLQLLVERVDRSNFQVAVSKQLDRQQGEVAEGERNEAHRTPVIKTKGELS